MVGVESLVGGKEAKPQYPRQTSSWFVEYKKKMKIIK